MVVKGKLILNTTREIKKSKGRFIAILLIVLLGTGFYAGITASSPAMKATAQKYYYDYNLHDLQLSSLEGFDEEELKTISQNKEIRQVEGRYSIDQIIDESEVKVLSFNQNNEINQFRLIEGRLPNKIGEILIDDSDHHNLEIGSIISFENDVFKTETFEVTGIVTSPLYLSFDRGKTNIGDGNIDYFIVIDEENFNLPFYTEVYITFNNTKGIDSYDDQYLIELEKSMDNLLLDRSWLIKTRFELNGYSSFLSDVEVVEKISKIIPIFFALIAILVTLTTMTRMVEEQRLEIGTLSALGFSKFDITFKYIIYSFLATLIGTILGNLISQIILPQVIFNAFGMLYILPNLNLMIKWEYIIISLIGAVPTITIATIIAAISILKSQPSQLFFRKAPKAGKKILLERIGFIWKKLTFNLKMTLRNIFRFKRRSLITIIGVAGCAGLMLTGFGLENAITNVSTKQFEEIFTYDGYALINPYFKDSEIEGIIKVSQDNVIVKGKDETYRAQLLVPENPNKLNNFINLVNRKTNEKLSINDQGVIISEKLAQLLNVKKGDVITVRLNNIETYIYISDVTENYINNYLYLSPNLYQDKFDNLNYNTILFNLDKGITIDNLKARDGVIATSLTSENKEVFNKSANNLAFVIVLIILASGLLAFIVLYNFSNINITERVKELSTFKVLGMKDIEVSIYIARENIITTIFGIGVGYLIGVYFEKYVISIIENENIMFIKDINFLSYLYTFILTIIFLFIVNLFLHFKLKKLDILENMNAYQ